MTQKRQLPQDLPRWERFKNCTHDARLLYMLLYTIADDEGRMLEDVGNFAYVLFPGESVFGLKIEALLREMEREQLIGRYDVRRAHYIVISDWDIQKVDHPKPSRLPAPPSTQALFVDEIAIARARRDH